MTFERWKKLDALFYEALELEGEARAAHLAKVCGDDGQLREEAERLIAAHERESSFIDSPNFAETGWPTDNSRNESLVGRSIGPYQVITQLGRGGMGEVYLAEDARLERKIALKLLPAAFTHNPDRVRRFEREARAASALNHPNILTIYEIGEADDTHYIVSEYVEGETLRVLIERGRLGISQAMAIAEQVASALNVAHRAGIIHRDIKPENVMVRPDGLVKVLDFGLAKLTERLAVLPEASSQAETLARLSTEPGMVMGTVSYMSPEQARGQKVDARSDIFSLGIVLYEMIAGASPFNGANAVEVMAAILKTEPARLSIPCGEAMAHELERIVDKALRKDRDERYQAVNDLLSDLKDLKQEVEFTARLELSRRTDWGVNQKLDEGMEATAQLGAAPTGEATAVVTSPGAKSVVSWLKHYKLGVPITIAAVALVAIATFFHLNGRPPLTEKDTILLADIVNATGDPAFDGTLRPALAVKMAESPFLNLLPESEVRETLRFMGRSPDERLAPALAREVCQRRGVKALLTGTLTALGNYYIITLEAVNGHTGDVLVREQAEVESKEQTLRRLGQAAARLRARLGESLSSVQAFNAPLERATTSSLEALKQYSLGEELRRAGKFTEALPFYRSATELDPNFALAYARQSAIYADLEKPALSGELAAKAYALRDRVGERERYIITFHYYNSVTNELVKAIEVLEQWRHAYPRDHIPPSTLGSRYALLGMFEKTIEVSREAMRLNPRHPSPHSNLGGALIKLNRFEEAKAVYSQALAQKVDFPTVRLGTYILALINRDAATQRQQLEWAAGTPHELTMISWQANAAAFAGRLREADALSRRGLELAERSAAKEVAARFKLADAATVAMLGDPRRAGHYLREALTLDRNSESLISAAYLYSLCGETAQAQTLAQELTRRHPKDQLLHEVHLPIIDAAQSLPHNPARAIQLLLPVSRFEAAANFWPKYLRGQAYLRQRDGAAAATEFQRIIDNRGESPFSAFYPLAYLGLARAAYLASDAARSRAAYLDLFEIWRDADTDLPALIEAKREYAKLK